MEDTSPPYRDTTKKTVLGGDCRCHFRLDHRPVGTRGARKQLYFLTKKAAEKFLSETSAKVTGGEYLDRNQVSLFGTTAEEWLRSKGDRRPSYTEGLRSRLDIYLFPNFAQIPLDRVSVTNIEKLRDDMRERGLSTVTTNGVIRVIGGVFAMAIRRGLCTINPVQRVERAYAGVRELDPNREGEADPATPETVLAPDEVALITHTEPGLYKTLLIFLAAIGLRSGEAQALPWSDCQLGGAEPKIYVRRSLSWAHIQGEDIGSRFFPPKTKSGHRTISMPEELATMLKHWQIACPPSEHDLVFPNAEGYPVRRSLALRRGLFGQLCGLQACGASTCTACGTPLPPP
jgi:integrase